MVVGQTAVEEAADRSLGVDRMSGPLQKLVRFQTPEVADVHTVDPT